MTERRDARLERLLAGLLRHGTWIASAVTSIGVVAASFGGTAGTSGWPAAILTAGIACFIILPIARVVLTLGVFIRDRDYRYIACTSIVLAIILAGLEIGRRIPASP